MSESDYLNTSSSTGGWSQPTTVFAYSIQPQNSLQTSFPRSGTYTVEFSVNIPALPPGMSPASVIQCDAIISWVLEGNRITRRVSVSDGLSISGTAQGVQVQLVDTSYDTSFVPPPATAFQYTITVSATPGVRGSVKVLPTLALLWNVTAANSPQLVKSLASAGPFTVSALVPQDCGVRALKVSVAPSNSLLGVVADLNKVTVAFKSSSGVTTYVYAPATDPDFVPLPAGTASIQVTYLADITDLATVDVSAVWGIDG